MRRFTLLFALVAAVALTSPLPARAIIHENVASFCSGLPNPATVDPPGQLNTRGNSFARALQATKIYTFEEGVDQAGQIGFNAMTETFGPLPGPGGEFAVTVWVDPTRPNAKLGDFLFWVYFVDDELFPEPIHVYLQVYELNHPAFAKCPKFAG